MTLRVLLVEDHHLVREAFLNLLARVSDVNVVAATGSGLEAVSLAATLAPDVVVMDLGLPDLSGIEATRQIIAGNADAKILCLSGQQDRHHVDAALRAGAIGYQIKECAGTELVDAIRAVGAGRTYLCPSVAATVVSRLTRKPGDAAHAHADLTERERQVLTLMAEGQSVKELAFTLSISVQTAYTHRRHIMKKLEMTEVANLIKFAIREGLTSA